MEGEMNDLITVSGISESRTDIITQTTRAVCTIIHEQVPVGVVFDSHFVIAELMKDGGNLYAKFAAFYGTLPAAHSGIAKLIPNCTCCEHLTVNTIARNSVSKNIRDNRTLNAAWIRTAKDCAHVKDGNDAKTEA